MDTSASMASVFSEIQSMTLWAWSMPSTLSTGARVMASDSTFALAPPAAVMTDIPLDTDATRAPSVVAMGTRNDPLAWSPSISTGPAYPRGTWITPIMFSTLVAAAFGSKGYEATASRLAPV